MSCQPCSGCPMKPSPPHDSCPARFECPQNSPRRICIVPPIQQGPRWKPCCIWKYNYPCSAHARPRRTLKFNAFDLAFQY